MKILIVGSSGQLGRELLKTAPVNSDIVAFGKNELDISSFEAVQKTVKERTPQVIINAAAYTAVDKAEQEEEKAFAVNSQGTRNLAETAFHNEIRFIHISTDFVFDGKKSRPYLPNDKPNPNGVYGASKLAGEQHIAEIIPDKSVILRTSWVYSVYGKNFVKTMLQLMRKQSKLVVVADQVGTPTWAFGLADIIWRIVESPDICGIYHWTDAGVASWYDFAAAIQEEAKSIGLIKRIIPIIPVRTEDYPVLAVRPPYAVLDKTGTWDLLDTVALHWRVNLRNMLRELKRLFGNRSYFSNSL